MKRTLTSPDSVASPSLQPVQFSIVFTSPGKPTPLNRGGISGDLTRLFSTKTVLRGVKETEECDEAHVDLTR